MTRQELASTFTAIGDEWYDNCVGLDGPPDGDGWRLLTVVRLKGDRVQLIWAREVEVDS